ncbi:MAG: SURF1 family protein [Alphaproteobacteria bacterium]
MGDSDRRRGLLWPTVITALGVLILVGLGTWQLHRLAWKEKIVRSIEAHSTAPVLDGLPDDVPPAELAFRHVRLTGTFLHDKEMYLTGRTHKGVVGLHVVTPLRLEDGRIVLVDRGWVPPDRAEPRLRSEGLSDEPVEVEGMIRTKAHRGPLTPDNRPDQNLWFHINVSEMAKYAGVALLPFYVEAGSAVNPGGYPVGSDRPIEVRNDHLQYAATWYALAVALVVIYVVYRRRQR